MSSESTSEYSDIDNKSNSKYKKRKKVSYKYKSYKQNYVSNWEHKYNWLKNVNQKAYCTACEKHIIGGITHLQRHEETSYHKARVKVKSTCVNIASINFFKHENVVLDKKVKEAEAKLCAFLAEHNLPMRLMEHLIPLQKSIFPDSKIASYMNCGRTKSSKIIENVLREESFRNIIEDLKCYPFSLILDETTDISTLKSMATVVRYANNNLQVHDKFLSLLEVKSGTADGLYQAVKTLLDENKIPYKNLIGFAGDHASVMMGQHNGVQAKLKQINPNIFTLGCVCHSFHTASSYACEKLPRSIEEFVQDVVNYFSNSAKRIKQFEEFQSFTETSHHKLVKLSCTRWLSLQNVVNRILEQCAPLKLYFTAEVANAASLRKAANILDAFNNPIYNIYLLFLSYILKIVNDLNLEFQSEKPKLYNLVIRIKELYKSILKSFIKKNVIDKYYNNIGQIVFSNPENFLKLEDIYVGAKASNQIMISDIPDKDLYNFRLRVLDFYVCLCSEITKRFNFDCEILNFLINFQPSVAKSGYILTISRAEIYFPDLVTSIEDLDMEWRLLPEIESLKNVSDDCYWETVASLKNSFNNSMFPNLIKFVNGILALPHSSAAAERVFSQLTLIKTKTRNRLFIKTCDALLSTKELLRGRNCYEWVPSQSILSCWKWNKQYSHSNTDVEEHDEVVFVE